jgi:DNA-binding GntR family transcriptional regulator
MKKIRVVDQFKTKNQLAYERLKIGIIQGDYEPGSNLLLHAIAKGFGISEIPVREALKKLEAEGLVSNAPHFGFIVTEPDFKNQREIFQVRQLLEGYATWLAAGHISSETFQKLKDLLEEMKKKVSKDMIRLAELNYQFHDLIYSSCQNPILYRLIQQVWTMAPRTRSIYSLIKGRAQSSIQEHENIYRHLVARDAEGAKKALIKHKQESYDLLLQYTKSNADIREK